MRKFLFFSTLILTVYVGTKAIGRADLIKRLTDNSARIQCVDLGEHNISFWKWARVSVSVDGQVFFNYSYLDTRTNPVDHCDSCKIERTTIDLKKVNGFSIDPTADKTFLILRNFSSDFYGVFKCRSFYEFLISGQSSMVSVEDEQDGELDQNGSKEKPPRPLKLTVG